MNALRRTHVEEGELAGQGMALALPRAALRGTGGARLGHDTGHSIDFRDYREYQAGDDLRHVDWNVFARSDHMVVKLFRDEVSPHLDLLLDTSASMNVEPGDKSRTALHLAAGLCAAASNAHCTTTLWITGHGARRIAPPMGRPVLWEDFEFDARMPPPQAIEAGIPSWRRHGMRIFTSDLLWPGDPPGFLRRFSEGAAAVAVLHVMGRQDAEPAASGYARLHDSESGEEVEMFVDAVMRERYRRALSAHVSNWQRACRQAGALFVSLNAFDRTATQSLAALQEAGVMEPA